MLKTIPLFFVLRVANFSLISKYKYIFFFTDEQAHVDAVRYLGVCVRAHRNAHRRLQNVRVSLHCQSAMHSV